MRCIKIRVAQKEMGLERRGNGIYYYRKERRGDRVVSVYQGKGEMAHLMHAWDQIKRQEADGARYELENAKTKFTALDEQIEELEAEVRAVETALFLINGYREHSRQWRKQRLSNLDTNERSPSRTSLS